MPHDGRRRFPWFRSAPTTSELLVRAILEERAALDARPDAAKPHVIHARVGGMPLEVDTGKGAPLVDVILDGERLRADAHASAAWSTVQREAMLEAMGEPATASLDAVITDRLSRSPPASAQNEWVDVAEGVRVRAHAPFHIHNGLTRIAKVWHDRYGLHEIGWHVVEEGTRRRREAAMRRALGDILPVPAIITGDARAMRVGRLAAEAVRRWPALADRAGTPIEPLVRRHLPRLLDAHRRAAATEPASRLGDADRTLAEGLDRIAAAVEEGLAVVAEDAARDLATEIGFLRLRHPG